jgi:hypothetical protein
LAEDAVSSAKATAHIRGICVGAAVFSISTMAGLVNLYVLLNARNMRSPTSVATYKASGTSLANWLQSTRRFPNYRFVAGNPSNASVERFFRTRETTTELEPLATQDDGDGKQDDDDDETEDEEEATYAPVDSDECVAIVAHGMVELGHGFDTKDIAIPDLRHLHAFVSIGCIRYRVTPLSI